MERDILKKAVATFSELNRAVIDRLVHYATIFDINVESYRRRTALDRKRGFG